MSRFLSCLRFLPALIPLAAAPAAAQDFPVRPVRLVAPFAPGGASDILARAIARKLVEIWGQQVVVENRPGATGIIGTELVARSAPDGYTIMLGNSAALAVNVSMYRKLPYHPLKDLACISEIARLPMLLVVHPSLPVASVKELIALARARPGQLDFGSSGIGSPPHLAGELLNLRAKVKIVHVPYKGAPLALNDLMGGHITMSFVNPLTVLRASGTGRIKPLGVSSLKRLAAAPDVPTIAEAGLPGFEEYIWFAVAAPAATPAAAVRTLNAGIVAALKSSDVSAMLSRDGAEITGSTPQQCAAFIESEIRKYADIIKRAGITPQE